MAEQHPDSRPECTIVYLQGMECAHVSSWTVTVLSSVFSSINEVCHVVLTAC